MRRWKVIVVCMVGAVVFMASLYLNSRLLSGGGSFMPEKSVYERVKALRPERRGARIYFGEAWKERRDGNNILFVTGTPYEMGYQHGVLLRDEIRRGVVPLFADPVTGAPEHRKKPAWLRWLLLKYLELAVFGPIERHSPHDSLQELKGLADGAGMDYGSVFIANMKSDLSMAMAPKVIKGRARALSIGGECTSIAAAGKATADGRLVVGRNTDYSGQGLWMANQTIFIARPAGGYAYVRVETAGMLKCNSAMNEKGITVGGHFMVYDGATPSGVSFTFLEHQLMRRAASLDEAIGILERTPRGGSFAFMITDGNSRDAAVVESSRDRLGVKRMSGGTLSLTNCALTDELKPADLIARYNMMMRNMEGRHLRADELLKKHYGRITLAVAAAIMGDHHDVVVGKERGVGIAIGAVSNVTSVVFLPAEGLFWVATGGEPACNSRFYGYDFLSFLKGSPPRVAPAVLEGYRWKDPHKEKALRAYMEAFAAHERSMDDFQGILAPLQRARALDPEEPIYPLIMARLLTHHGEYDRAVSLIEGLLRLPQSNNERALAHLLCGQVHDLKGERAAALRCYEKIISNGKQVGADYMAGINGFVFALARDYRKRPFSRKAIYDIPIGFSQTTGVE